MKQYLVNEEDIYDLIYDVETNNEHIEKAKNFLKFKQPVQEIASGKVEISMDAQVTVNGNTLVYRFAEYNDKQIKIYIQEEK